MYNYEKITFILLLFFTLHSCTQNEEINQSLEEVTLKLGYDFFESGNMTRSGNELYAEFFNKYIKTKKFTPRIYELSFKNITNGDSLVVRGNWENNDFLSLSKGTYKIKGISYPISSLKAGTARYIAQDTVSLCFDETIEVVENMNNLILKASYDCFMLMFDRDNFKKIIFGDEDMHPVVSAYEIDDIYYMFFRDKKIIDDISTTFSSLNCTRNDGNITELWLNKFNFEKGKYYYFHDINGEFELPEMEPGR